MTDLLFIVGGAIGGLLIGYSLRSDTVTRLEDANARLIRRNWRLEQANAGLRKEVEQSPPWRDPPQSVPLRSRRHTKKQSGADPSP